MPPCLCPARGPTTHLVLGLYIGARCQKGMHHLDVASFAGSDE